MEYVGLGLSCLLQPKEGGWIDIDIKKNEGMFCTFFEDTFKCENVRVWAHVNQMDECFTVWLRSQMITKDEWMIDLTNKQIKEWIYISPNIKAI